MAGGAPTRVGLLHTVPALAGSFDAMLTDAASTGSAVQAVHLVDAGLLAAAIDHGVDDEVRASVLRHVRSLVDDGAEAVLVTCSSIGEAVELAAAQLDVPVLRVDEPMARQAVELARERAGESQPRIVALATLEATLGPTGRLIERAAAETGGGVDVSAQVVPDAAAARARGDQAEHDRLVREAVIAAAGTAEVLVLAQASMAAAVADVELGVPVLTSPTGGVAALLDAVAGVRS
jgi:aspartate/glutamate racemase